MMHGPDYGVVGLAGEVLQLQHFATGQGVKIDIDLVRVGNSITGQERSQIKPNHLLIWPKATANLIVLLRSSNLGAQLSTKLLPLQPRSGAQCPASRS